MGERVIYTGDWVRFYRNGELVIAQVEYVRKEAHYPWGMECLTAIGSVAERDVVEVRREPEVPHA